MPPVILVHGTIDDELRIKHTIQLRNGPSRIVFNARRIKGTVPFDDEHIKNLSNLKTPTMFELIIELHYDPDTVTRSQLFAAIEAASTVTETHVIVRSVDAIFSELLERVDAFKGDPNRPDDLLYLQRWAPAMAQNPAKNS